MAKEAGRGASLRIQWSRSGPAKEEGDLLKGCERGAGEGILGDELGEGRDDGGALGGAVGGRRSLGVRTPGCSRVQGGVGDEEGVGESEGLLMIDGFYCHGVQQNTM